MYATYQDINALMEAVKADKEIEGAGAYVANRYPIRFVLFDNFRDSYEFVSRLADDTLVLRISKWMEPDYPDIMLTHSKLATLVSDYIYSIVNQDLVIAPFSELARFYDNKNLMEFDALISTIKSIENDKEGYKNHRRVYIPIVGLAGKMSKFFNDSQSTIWYVKSDDHELNYRLVLTNNTFYGVSGLEEKYSIVTDVTHWLEAWNNQELTKTIISTSPAIFANAEFAQPDNAFSFCQCRNAYEFLTDGLGLDLKFISYKKENDDFWERLAKEVSINDFKFDEFFNSKFDIHELANYDIFIKTWFDFQEQYDRWLLAAYYIHKFCNMGYICQALQFTHGYTNVDFVESLALTIFSLDEREECIEERRTALKEAEKRGVIISVEAQDLLRVKLLEVADAQGYVTALKYISTATNTEKTLLIEWIGNKKLMLSDIKDVYPDLYAYMRRIEEPLDESVGWIDRYYDSYRQAKIANKYTDDIKNQLLEVNGSDIAFNQWYQRFKTTRSLLDGRDDIEVYFWIDGLGIDWIPFVRSIVEGKRNDNYFLNEVMIGKALLPTKTSTNKEDLLKLAGEQLPKIGDIDEVAHQCRPYPQYIISDIKAVKNTIYDILAKNPGRKIAIVSDHGMSFLPQLCEGLNLAGYQSDHNGRLAIKKSGLATADEKYIVLEDGKTICALRHESLCAKVPTGSGCHGGCTPEEVLVPIFIISNQPNVKTWTAVLKTMEVSTSSPFVKFAIKGLKAGQTPYIIYKGVKHVVGKVIGNEYQSDILALDIKETTITLCIGTDKQDFTIKIKQGFEEEDLFGDIL
jgi:hypothetical protein